MTSSILENKSSSNDVAVDAITWVSRIRRHIEIMKCDHCKRVLNNIEVGDQPTPDFADNTHNPTGKPGSEYYNE